MMDLEAQNDELIVLSSIYEDYFQEADVDIHKGGQLAIHLDILGSVTLVNDTGSVDEASFKVKHLPPIFLNFHYPEDYPSSSAPKYTLSCKWITRPQLTILCKELDKLWEENKGDVILYTWTQHLKENALSILGINDTISVAKLRPRQQSSSQRQPEEEVTPTVGAGCSESSSNTKRSDTTSDVCDISNSNEKCISLDHPNTSRLKKVYVDSRTIQNVGPKANMLMLLRDYHKEMERNLFNKKSFQCNVCFCDKIGNQCLVFWPCDHVYCKNCMKDYFEVQIKEGNVKFLKCPTEKCDSDANPKQVEELVSPELYERWEALLLTSTLSALGDTQPCPRMHCQYPVTMDDDQGSCPACSFVFCGLCRACWHGVEPCRLNNSSLKEVMQYYSTGDAKIKAELEARYGKKQLQKLHNEYLSMSYLNENTKKCPKCSSKIQKIDGCNKMQCNHCGSNFCWLCMKILNLAEPYDHFNTAGGSCANKLFEGVVMNDDEYDFVDVDDYFDDDFEDAIFEML